jgi:hypothetical protein
MATFYVLPARFLLDAALGEVLARFLPGLPLPADTWEAVADRVASAAGWGPDVYLIPRDDLPDGEKVADALTSGFGAEPGDRVIEVGVRTGVRHWTVEPGSVSASAGAR